MNSEIARLPLHSKGNEEKILITLLSGPKSYNELTKIVPNGSLYRSLKRLKRSDLIIKSNLSGHIFYYASKRRPTRRLSPTEMRIFKALPKEGISVRNLSEKVGISVRRVYKYLRRLRRKRHIEKVEKTAFYKVTDAGRHLAQPLNTAYTLIQS
jgi:predicted transcriptional regulator